MELVKKPEAPPKHVYTIGWRDGVSRTIVADEMRDGPDGRFILISGNTEIVVFPTYLIYVERKPVVAREPKKVNDVVSDR